MATIKAPFNFVPLSDKVFFPNWADKISQDIPFEDGVSGTIELKITAQTPIFVRNGHTKEDAEAKNDKYKSFSKTLDNRYFIPATTIKGCIRNVLEIMSFGKMRLDKNAKFAQREWDNPALYPLKGEQNNFHCGWIKPDGDDYVLIDCGKPMRIAMDKIDKYVGSKVMHNHFSKDKGIDLNNAQTISGVNYDPKTAIYKYKLLENYNLSNLSFDYDREYCNEHKDNRLSVRTNGEIHGTIVLTGQPDKYMYPRPTRRPKGAGKFYEFVFCKPERDAKRYEISAEQFNHYKFIYADSPDWEFALSRLNGEGIPVFFRTERGNLKDFGLAFLYKLPYDRTPYETLGSQHRSDSFDLADCIFGYTNGEKALRGRVQFSSAFSENAETDNSVKLLLGSPKASYYPIYVKQDGRNGTTTQYKTYNDSSVSGWKRYLVRKNIFGNITGTPNEDVYENVSTEIFPIKKGAEFVCQVHFHNLKRVELGAILSTITFHNTSNCYHQIGQGKPYGFGKVVMSVQKLRIENDNIANTKQEDFLIDYEEAMYNELGDSWVRNNQIQQLFTLAHEEVTEDDIFKYLIMSTNSNDNEFLAAKIAKKYLQTYTELANKVITADSLYEPIRLEREKQKEEELKKQEELKKEKELQEQQRREQQEMEERLAKKEEKLNAGLSFLLKKRVDNDELMTTELSKGLGQVKKFLEKNKDYSVSDSDKRTLLKWLKLIPYPTKKADKQDFENFEGNSWKYISQFAGSGLAQQWFDELIKS